MAMTYGRRGAFRQFYKNKNKNKNQWAICKALLGVAFWRQITRKKNTAAHHSDII
jgi:hypothetical protein